MNTFLRIDGFELSVEQIFREEGMLLAIVNAERGEVVKVSDGLTALRLLGAPSLLGRRLVNLCHFDDRYRVQQWLQGSAPDSGPYLTAQIDPLRSDLTLTSARWHLLRLQTQNRHHVVLALAVIDPPISDAPVSLEHLLDWLPTDMVVLNAEGRYLYCNRTAIRDDDVRQRIIGMTDREYVEWRGLPLVVAEVREQQFRCAQQERRPQSWEEVLPTPQGQRVFRRTYRPVFNADHSFNIMIGHGTDITSSVEQAHKIGLLERVVLASRDPTMILDAQQGESHMRLVYANLAFEQLSLNGTLSSLIGTRPTEWGFGRADGQLIAALLEQLELDNTLDREVWFPDRQQWVEFTGDALKDDQGVLTHWSVHIRNVTVRKRIDLLRRSRAWSSTLSLREHSLPEVLTPILGGIQQWAQGWQVAAVYGFDDKLEVTGNVSAEFKAWLTRISAHHAKALWAERDPQRSGQLQVYKDLWNDPQVAQHHDSLQRAGLRSTIEIPLYGRQMELTGILFLGHPDVQQAPDELITVLEEEATVVALYLEQDQQRRRLRQMAYHDTLTGLLNRAAFLEQIDRATSDAAESERPLALALLDLDRFKQVNDGLGHAVGDTLLTEFAQRLLTLTSNPEVRSLARLGGDEFAFLLHDTLQIGAISAAIETLIQLPFVLAGRTVRSGVSVGWSVFPRPASDPAALLRQADAAMYVAKRTQQIAHLYSAVSQPRHKALVLEHALHEALEGGQFQLVYQPQVRSGDRRVQGAEALLRWVHPSLGEISPTDFIAVAEETGLIHALGAWVLRTACTEATAWPNPDLSLSVNVSAVQLADPGFPAQVRVALRQSKLPPYRLVLEVTETGFLSDLFQTQQSLQSLRQDGVRVSIDDFGTGYSTLATLHDLPVDELKIDRRFVQELAQQGSRAIVQSTIALAHVLGLTVVAEGVETEEQASLLNAAGCDLLQGWLIAKGLPQHEFCRSFGA